MLFFRKKEPRKKSVFENSDQVFLYRGAYYCMEKTEETEYTVSLIPGDEVNKTEFLELALDCMKTLVADKTVVLNNLTAATVSTKLWEEPFVQEYIAQGGTPVFPVNYKMYTTSRGLDKGLVERFPRDIYGCFYLTIHGYEPGEDMRYERCISAHYNEDHQYLEIIAPKGLERHVEAVRELCGKHGKELCIINSDDDSV